MVANIKENLPEFVIDILKLVKRYREDAHRNPDFDTLEALRDLETYLCDLLSAMIASPLTGRLFLQPPAAYVPEDEAQRSLRANLGQD